MKGDAAVQAQNAGSQNTFAWAIAMSLIRTVVDTINIKASASVKKKSARYGSTLAFPNANSVTITHAREILNMRGAAIVKPQNA